jgi:hypothetical protein
MISTWCDVYVLSKVTEKLITLVSYHPVLSILHMK